MDVEKVPSESEVDSGSESVYDFVSGEIKGGKAGKLWSSQVGCVNQVCPGGIEKCVCPPCNRCKIKECFCEMNKIKQCEKCRYYKTQRACWCETNIEYVVCKECTVKKGRPIRACDESHKQKSLERLKEWRESKNKRKGIEKNEDLGKKALVKANFKGVESSEYEKQASKKCKVNTDNDEMSSMAAAMEDLDEEESGDAHASGQMDVERTNDEENDNLIDIEKLSSVLKKKYIDLSKIICGNKVCEGKCICPQCQKCSNYKCRCEFLNIEKCIKCKWFKSQVSCWCGVSRERIPCAQCPGNVVGCKTHQKSVIQPKKPGQVKPISSEVKEKRENREKRSKKGGWDEEEQFKELEDMGISIAQMTEEMKIRYLEYKELLCGNMVCTEKCECPPCQRCDSKKCLCGLMGFQPCPNCTYYENQESCWCGVDVEEIVCATCYFNRKGCEHVKQIKRKRDEERKREMSAKKKAKSGAADARDSQQGDDMQVEDNETLGNEDDPEIREREEEEKEKRIRTEEDQRIWQNYIKVSRKIIDDAHKTWSKMGMEKDVVLIKAPMGQLGTGMKVREDMFNSLCRIPVQYRRLEQNGRYKEAWRYLRGDKDYGDFKLQSHPVSKQVFALAVADRNILEYLVEKSRFPFWKKNRNGQYEEKGQLEIKSLTNPEIRLHVEGAMVHQIEKYKKALFDLYTLKIGGEGVVTVISQEVTTEVKPKHGAPYKVRNETGKIIVKIKLNEFYSEEAVRNIFAKKFKIYVDEVGWRDMIATIDGEKEKCIFCNGNECTYWECNKRCKVCHRPRTEEHDKNRCIGKYGKEEEVSRTGRVLKETERCELLSSLEAYKIDKENIEKSITEWEEVNKNNQIKMKEKREKMEKERMENRRKLEYGQMGSFFKPRELTPVQIYNKEQNKNKYQALNKLRKEENEEGIKMIEEEIEAEKKEDEEMEKRLESLPTEEKTEKMKLYRKEREERKVKMVPWNDKQKKKEEEDMLLKKCIEESNRIRELEDAGTVEKENIWEEKERLRKAKIEILRKCRDNDIMIPSYMYNEGREWQKKLKYKEDYPNLGNLSIQDQSTVDGPSKDWSEQEPG